jgi:hypothetical protein
MTAYRNESVETHLHRMGQRQTPTVPDFRMNSPVRMCQPVSPSPRTESQAEVRPKSANSKVAKKISGNAGNHESCLRFEVPAMGRKEIADIRACQRNRQSRPWTLNGPSTGTSPMVRRCQVRCSGIRTTACFYYSLSDFSLWTG